MAPTDGRVVTNLAVRALEGEPLVVYGTGEQTRSFQYVDDLVEGVVRLMRTEYSAPVNLGRPEELTMIALVREGLARTLEHLRRERALRTSHA